MATLEVLFALHIALCLLRILPALHHLLVLTVWKLAENLDSTGDLGGISFLPAPRLLQDVAAWQSHWRDNLHAKPTLVSTVLGTHVSTTRHKTITRLFALDQQMAWVVRMACHY